MIHPQYEIVVEDIEYLRHPSGPLLARLYRPAAAGPAPLMVQIHGGAWCRGSRLDEDSMNQALARSGIAVAALDFRMPPIAAYPASLADINYAVRWLKQKAPNVGTRPDLISLMGVSSGGHQAMLAAMRSQDPRYTSIALPDCDGIDAKVRSVVLGWPVIDPIGRYQYALEWQASGRPYPEAIDRVIPDHVSYWGTEEAMEEGSPPRMLERREAVDLPPVLCLQGDQDQVHPRVHIESFAAAYREAGGSFTMRWFEDEKEGFITKKPESTSALEAIQEIVRFLNADAYTFTPGTN